MARLIETSPCAGLLPRTIGAVDLSEVEPAQITLIAPFKGQQAAVSDALDAALGLTFPAPNRATGRGARAVWSGAGQAFLIGTACPALPGAACIDQSDAWAIVRIEGADAARVLARLTPLDLRPEVFQQDHTARSVLGQMPVSLTRAGRHAYEVMVMRSMARTLVQELIRAAQGVADRVEPSI
ncbi:sarcosine oxidase subunit gamma [Thalassorhabdomicrobium marinisediminis]|uniref:sarcosine oxidase subunit gamma n=1 Tax=Thalassorhabdomicrobium marinisediminis TaxID=2170577 RepID=UPI002490B2A9|nr:sarcosine oxidase subunit gamma [Thalassorhabdomicrobium marinisediminis]